MSINPHDKRFYASASSGATVESFPSQDFYRSMRHRELQAYRSVIQSIVMHHPTSNTSQDDSAATTSTTIQLTRAQIRLLEDLETELVIPSSRRDIEIQDALNDITITAVRTSGVADRRPLHFDGINDVPIANNNNNSAGNDIIIDDDTDDDGAIVGIGQKAPSTTTGRRGRNNNNDSSSSNNTNNAGSSKPNQRQVATSKPLDTATANQLRRLSQDIPLLCQEYVECGTSTPDQQQKRMQIEIKLRKMQSEVMKIRTKAVENCANQG